VRGLSKNDEIAFPSVSATRACGIVAGRAQKVEDEKTYQENGGNDVFLGLKLFWI
jgi:hypothetical protein